MMPKLQLTDPGDLVRAECWVLCLEHHDPLAHVFRQPMVFLCLGRGKETGHPIPAKKGDLTVESTLRNPYLLGALSHELAEQQRWSHPLVDELSGKLRA